MSIRGDYSISVKKLQIERKDCSPLGCLILDHLEANQLSVAELARRIGCAHNVLKLAFWRGANPQEKVVRGLSRELGILYKDLQLMIFDERIRYQYNGAPEFLLIAIERMYEVLRAMTVGYPEGERPSEYVLMEEAFNEILSFYFKGARAKAPKPPKPPSNLEEEN